jgi:gliding motility-associated-like protein
MIFNRILIVLILIIGFFPKVLATHNRGGQILFEPVAGQPLRYKATIIICTNEGQNIADRPKIEIQWGDGEKDTLNRLTNPPTGPNHSLNYYVGEHTYPGYGSYTLSVLDPNRNAGILNIQNSVNTEFCIKAELVISPFVSSNFSPVIDDLPCPIQICPFKKWCYSPAAYDPDGDSLSYELITPSGSECLPMLAGANYWYPNNHGPNGNSPGYQGSISIDNATGIICWDMPTIIGEYNIAIKVIQWKRFNNTYAYMGYVMQDLQVTVVGLNLCQNDAPVITPLQDYCVEAGANINFTVTATDPNNNPVSIQNFGQPFFVQSSPATFSGNTQGTSPHSRNFNWNTNCTHIRKYEYPLTFISSDIPTPPNISQSNIAVVNIKVLPPAVTGLNVVLQPNNTMLLNWNPSACNNIKGYKIYRKLGNGPNPPNCCDDNTALAMGYTFVGVADGHNNTTYIDNNAFVLGEDYCYIVTAYMQDGSESCPSNEDCDHILMTVPVITKVSVGATDVSNGVDTLVWVHPQELDTSNLVSFFYRIYRSDGFTGANTLIHTTTATNLLYLQPTQFLVNNLNTVNTPHNYRVELEYSDINSVTGNGFSNNASSIFLSATPADNQITLTWQHNVPWNNFRYDVYRVTGVNNFIYLGTTTQKSYTDTGLINGVTYCYRVKSAGKYSSPLIPDTLYNWSQELCSAPVDLTPPCPPILSIESNCEIPVNDISWTNPNNYCADDVMSYTLYYSPTQDGAFSILATFNSALDTSFIYSNNISVAGCYYVTATDSAQYGNESIASNVVCTDNCPVYFLPNVFSPNGDGQNDFFIPFPYRFVEKIDLKIYNRWGTVVFETNDPNINWDGRNMVNGEMLSDGVYYYTCTVYTIRLTGTDPVDLHGFVHLYTNENKSK